MRRTPRRTRRWVALTACFLWLLGAEVLPNLHLAAHDDDHTHEAGGAIVRVSLHETHEHRHGDGPSHTHAADRAHGKRGDRLAISEAPSGHAASGIAHHAVALHRPPPPLLEPLPVDRAAWLLAAAHDDQYTPAFALRPTARGPPARS